MICMHMRKRIKKLIHLLTSGMALASFPKMTPITLVFLLILSLDLMKFIASQMFENSMGTPDYEKYLILCTAGHWLARSSDLTYEEKK